MNVEETVTIQIRMDSISKVDEIRYVNVNIKKDDRCERMNMKDSGASVRRALAPQPP